MVRFAGGLERETERLRRILARLRHRGPDGEGVDVSERAGLIHTRLALSDPNHGTQPMRSPDGRYRLVYNGEIYNASELRGELRDRWTFRSRCDTEAVLAAWAAWGPDALTRLNGMFALFIWDELDQAGYVARDRLGIKPLVYTFAHDAFLFASEAKALVPELSFVAADRDALLEYLVAPCFSGVEAPLFAGLHHLAPGHVMELRAHGHRSWAWAQPWPKSWTQQDLGAPPPNAEALREALQTAVARTSIADAPVGVYLSGGLDSTLIASSMCRSGQRPRAFTIAFEGQDRFDYARSRIVGEDDGPYAALASATFELEQEIVTVERSNLADDLRTLAHTNDALPAWEQELAQHHLASIARRTCKAVLVGDAADETHFGYHFLLDEAATRSPRGILERFSAPIISREILPDPLAHFDAKYRSLACAAGERWQTPNERIAATTWLIVHRWLPRLLHNGDIHAMAHGLEARVPFGDTELLELAARVPATLGLAGGEEKALLREAGRGLVPEPIRRRKKSALPKDQGYAAQLQQQAAALLPVVASSLQHLIDLPSVLARCDPRRVPDENDRALLFRLICLAHWIQHYDVKV